MVITKAAAAGTMESSDIMIEIMPGSGEVTIDLTSTVDMYYHDAIIDTIRTVLQEKNIDSAAVKAVDHGALDCTIRARVTTALRRARG